MAYEDYCRKMESLKYLIDQECTGDANEFADKLGVSRRTVFHYLETLRDEGTVIQYCKYRRTYHYREGQTAALP